MAVACARVAEWFCREREDSRGGLRAGQKVPDRAPATIPLGRERAYPYCRPPPDQGVSKE